MHTLIAAIVEAESKTAALSRAKEVFNLLMELSMFDYYSTFDEKHAVDRWGKLFRAAKVNSQEGKQLIHDLMDATRDELFESLRAIREFLQKHSDEDMWNGDNFDVLSSEQKVYRLLKCGNKTVNFLESARHFRHHCLRVGSWEGPSVYIYDENGAGIRDRSDLKHVLEHKEKDKTWIVPADVHF